MRTQTPSVTLHKTLCWFDETDTQSFARNLAAEPVLRQVFLALPGELGAGKTTLVRHLLRALGITDRIKSPTYTVVEPYEVAGLAIWHFDFYRFTDPREWVEAGFRDIFASPGLKIAEWPDKAAGFLPLADLVLHIHVNEREERQIDLIGHTPAGVLLLSANP